MKKQSICAVICLFLLAVAVAGARSQKSQSAATKSGPQKPRTDPCTLLTNADIQAVQSDTVLETKPGVQPGNGLVMSQCLFRTATPSKSVSIAVAAPSSLSPRAFWLKQFHSGKAEGVKADATDATGPTKKTAVSSKKEEDESTRPRPISGVGEEAYWVGGPMVGALYVLKGDTFFRISLGGIPKESPRIQKSIALARAALKRF